MRPRISLRNSYRSAWESGYGRVNHGLERLVADILDDAGTEIQLFASPPYDFKPVPGRFNVGVTACERALDQYSFPFADHCNSMQLVLVPSDWDRGMLLKYGVTVPVVTVSFGHDHADWYQPIDRYENRRLLIFDRGRNDLQALSMALMPAFRNFEMIDYIRTGGAGPFTREQLKQRYRHSDVLLKMSREGAWSYPALEAMSAGCLVITNNPFVHCNPGNSLLFRSVEEIPALLVRCLTETFAELKVAAQATAAAWSWESAAGQIREVILKAYHKEQA